MSSDTLKPLCPAAEPIAGPPVGGPSILCGVVRRARRDLQTRYERDTNFGVLNTTRDNPSTIRNYCCSEGFTKCPLWRRARETEAEGRKFARTPEEKKAEAMAQEQAAMKAGLEQGTVTVDDLVS